MSAYIVHQAEVENIYDVDDGPMLRKRQLVMKVCVAQVLTSFALLINARRSPALAVLQPFFLSAGVLGYIGARRCNAMLVAAHFLGSAGLSLVFMIFLLAEAFLQKSKKDLVFFVINFPMDLFLLTTSGASVVLWLALTRLRRQLRIRRQQLREQFACNNPAAQDTSAPIRTVEALAWDSRRAPRRELPETPLTDADRAETALTSDLLCPITLEVMTDPVIAGDGHSYEREAIERWLQTHRTSPLTGRALPHSNVIANHRLRSLIEDLRRSRDLEASSGRRTSQESLPAAAVARTNDRPHGTMTASAASAIAPAGAQVDATTLPATTLIELSETPPAAAGRASTDSCTEREG